jgi:hypothetical protein
MLLFLLLGLTLGAPQLAGGMPPASTSTPALAPRTSPTGGPPQDQPHLTLSIEPAVAAENTLVTLRIAYTGVGLYDTTVIISPTSALVFDPPRTMPCRYNQDATACTQMTLRARELGIATLRASAYGEIHDPNCGCWVFSGVSDDGPAQVTIVEPRAWLPILRR